MQLDAYLDRIRFRPFQNNNYAIETGASLWNKPIPRMGPFPEWL